MVGADGSSEDPLTSRGLRRMTLGRPPHSGRWRTRLARGCSAGAPCKWGRLACCAGGRMRALQSPQDPWPCAVDVPFGSGPSWLSATHERGCLFGLFARWLPKSRGSLRFAWGGWAFAGLSGGKHLSLPLGNQTGPCQTGEGGLLPGCARATHIAAPLVYSLVGYSSSKAQGLAPWERFGLWAIRRLAVLTSMRPSTICCALGPRRFGTWALFFIMQSPLAPSSTRAWAAASLFMHSPCPLFRPSPPDVGTPTSSSRSVSKNWRRRLMW